MALVWSILSWIFPGDSYAGSMRTSDLLPRSPPPRLIPHPECSPFRVVCEKIKLSRQLDMSSEGTIHAVGDEIWFLPAPYGSRSQRINLSTKKVTTVVSNIKPPERRILCCTPSGIIVTCDDSYNTIIVYDGIKCTLNQKPEFYSHNATGDIPAYKFATPSSYLGINQNGEEELILFAGKFNEDLSVHTLNLTTFEWKEIQVAENSRVPPYRHRGYSICVVNSDRVLLFGGFREGRNIYYEELFNDVWEFNVRTGVWNLLESNTPPPFVRCYAVSVLQGDWMIVLGGTSVVHNSALDDCWGFNLITHEWHQLCIEGDDYPTLAGACWVKLIDGQCILVGGRWGPEINAPLGSNTSAYAFNFFTSNLKSANDNKFET